LSWRRSWVGSWRWCAASSAAVRDANSCSSRGGGDVNRLSRDRNSVSSSTKVRDGVGLSLREPSPQETLRITLSITPINLNDGNLIVTLIIHPVRPGSTIKANKIIITCTSLKPHGNGRSTANVILANPYQCQFLAPSCRSRIYSNLGIVIPVELKVLGRVETLEAVITIVWSEKHCECLSEAIKRSIPLSDLRGLPMLQV